MSRPSHTRQPRRTNRAFSVAMRNGTKLAKRLEKLKSGGKKAIKYTVSDFASNAPGWVSKGIRQHYGVDATTIKKARPHIKRGGTSIKANGISVDGATLKYKGESLTPIHFKMSPSTPHPKGLQTRRNRIPGQAIAKKAANPNAPFGMARIPVPYQVKATIIKGQRVAMMPGTYLAPSSPKNPNSPVLPFQRMDSGKNQIHSVRTLSVPQMIDGRAHDTIEQTINTKLESRFSHHIERAMK